MRFFKQIIFISLLPYLLFASNDCPKWLPISNGDTIFILPIYDMQITKRDFDCDGIIDIEDSDIDGDGINDTDKIFSAYNNHISNLQVVGIGIVVRILDDDTTGSQHQRFIIELPSGQTLLISHNIDLAPRINRLMIDSEIIFYGEYEWNDKGGLVHWTHHDPQGNHINGWLMHNGKIYE